MGLRAVTGVAVTVVLMAAGCSGDDESSDNGGAETTADDGSDAGASGGTGDSSGTDSGADDAEGGAAGGASGGGTLVLGEETIELDSARCFLEEQDAAGGGGKILFVAQAFGVDAGGEELVLDVSRYDEDSQFTGDDIIVDIGDPFSDDAVSLRSGGEVGTVAVDGSNLSAEDLVFVNFDDSTEQPGSFDINC